MNPNNSISNSKSDHNIIESSNVLPTRFSFVDVVKKVSKQLSRPRVCGFDAHMDIENYSALLKNVPADKIDMLLDEYMVEVCKINNNLIYYKLFSMAVEELVLLKSFMLKIKFL